MEGERERREVDRLRREGVGRVGPKSGRRRRRCSCEGSGVEEFDDVVVEETKRIDPQREDIQLRSEDDEDDGSS